MKKKLALSIAAAAMVGTLAVGGTLAWFTDTETATNVVTTGKVDVAILEKGAGDSVFEVVKEGETGVTINNAVPGGTYDKDAMIKNVGVNPAWVRAKIEVYEVNGENETLADLPEGAVTFVGTHTDWVKNTEDSTDEYFYYSKILTTETPSNETELLMSGVELDGKLLDNKYVGKNYKIKIFAEAVQSDNLVDESGVAVDNAIEAFAEDVVGENGVADLVEPSANN